MLGWMFLIAVTITALVYAGHNVRQRRLAAAVPAPAPLPPVASSEPLAPEERVRGAATQVWVVWYTDTVKRSGSYPVAVCLGAGDAQAEMTRRVRAFNKAHKSGWDGLEVLGPMALCGAGPEYDYFGAAVVREVLARGARGQGGAVAVS